MKRLSKLLPIIIPLIGLFIIGVYSLRKSASTSDQIQRLILSQMARVLRTDVSATSVTGDAWTGITFHNLTVGKDRTLPGGALFRANQVIVRYSGREILMSRRSLVGGISEISVLQPIVNIQRDARGRWNIAKLIPPAGKPKRREFAARVLVRDARVIYEDQAFKARSGQALRRDFHSVNAEAKFNGEDPIQFHGIAEDSEKKIQNPSVVGKVTADGEYVEALTTFTDSDAAFFYRFLPIHRDIHVASARARGKVRVIWAKTANLNDSFSLAGDLWVSHASFDHSKVRYPFRDLQGFVSFSDEQIFLNHVTGSFGDSHFTVSGQVVGLNRPVYALDVQSDRLNLNELMRLEPRFTGMAQVAASGYGAGAFRFVGGLSDVAVSGQANLPKLWIRSKSIGVIQTAPSRVTGYTTDLLHPTFNGSADISSAEWSEIPSTGDRPKVALHGISNIHLRIAEVPDHPSIIAEFDARSGAVDDVPFHKLRLQAEYEDQLVLIPRAQLNVANGSVETWGRVDLRDRLPAFAFSGRANRVSSQFAERFAHARDFQFVGSFSGAFAVNGNPQTINVSSRLSSDHFYAQVPYGSERTTRGSLKRPVRSLDGDHLEILARGQCRRVEGHWTPNLQCSLKSQKALVALTDETIGDVPMQNVEGLFNLNGDLLTIGALHGSLMGGVAAIAGHLNCKDGTLQTTLAGIDWNLSRLSHLGAKYDLGGGMNFHGDLSGTLEHPKFIGRVELLNAHWDRVPLSYATANVAVTQKQLNVSGGLLHELGGRYLVEGALTDIDWARREGRLGFHVRAESVGVSPLLDYLNIKADISGVGEGDLNVGGTLNTPKVNAVFQVNDGNAYGIPFDHAEADAVYDEGRLVVSQLRAAANGARLTANGTINQDGSLRFEFRGRDLPAVSAGRPVGLRPPIKGKVSVTGTVDGTTLDPALHASIVTEPLLVSGKSVGKVEGKVDVDRRRIQLAGLGLSGNENDISLNGTVPIDPTQPAMRMRIDARKARLADLLDLLMNSRAFSEKTRAGGLSQTLAKLQNLASRLPQPMEGYLQAEIALSGSPDRPEVGMDFTLPAGVSLHGEPFPATTAQMVWKDGRLVVDNFRAVLGDAVMVMKAGSVIDPRRELDVDFDVYNVNLDAFKPFLKSYPDVAGVAKVIAVKTRGPYASPEVTLSANVDGFKVGRFAFDRLAANRVTVSENAIRVEEDDLTVIRGRHRASLWGTLPIDSRTLTASRDRPIELHVRRKDEDLSVVPLFVSGVQKSAGKVSIDCTMTGTLNDPKFQGGVEVMDGSFAFFDLETPAKQVNATLTFKPDSNELVVRNFTGSMGSGNFSAGGSVFVTTDGLTDVTKNRYDLSFSAKQLAFTLRPTVDGLFKVDTHLAFRTLSDGTDEINFADLKLTNSKGGVARVVQDEKKQNARIDLQGAWTRKDTFLKGRFKVPVRVENFNLQIPKLLRSTIDATLQLADSGVRVDRDENEATRSPLTLEGDVKLSNTEVSAFPDMESQKRPLQLPAIPQLDLRVDLQRNVNINTRQLRIYSIRGNADIKGTLAEPNIHGTLLAQRGSIGFPAADAQLRSAQVDIFTAEDPDTGKPQVTLNVNAAAETHLENYDMRIAMNGPVVLGKPNQTFNIDVKTTPPISGEGTGLQKLLSLPSGEAFSEADISTKVYQSLFSFFREIPGVEEVFRNVIGVDTFNVDYNFGEAVNVRIGKEVAKGLVLSYRRTISGPRLGYAVRVDYRLKGRTVVAFETDERGFKQYSVIHTFNF